jgi:hypothetical protein
MYFRRQVERCKDVKIKRTKPEKKQVEWYEKWNQSMNGTNDSFQRRRKKYEDLNSSGHCRLTVTPRNQTGILLLQSMHTAMHKCHETRNEYNEDICIYINRTSNHKKQIISILVQILMKQTNKQQSTITTERYIVATINACNNKRMLRNKERTQRRNRYVKHTTNERMPIASITNEFGIIQAKYGRHRETY